jgi:hypothetical protein
MYKQKQTETHMFRLIGKLIKWSLVALVAVVAFGMYLGSTDPESVARRAAVSECQETHGKIYCDKEGNVLDKATVDAEIAAKAEATRIRMQEAAERKVAEAAQEAADKIERDRKFTLQTVGRRTCEGLVRASAKYPSKVDFAFFGADDRVWENFNASADLSTRYMLNTKGEMMNGLGMMVPFTAHCKIDMNVDEYKVVDFWVN